MIQGSLEVGATPNVTPLPIQPPLPKAPKIKELVLNYVEHVYPRSAKALEIRNALEAKGLSIHEKTVGMTLYRLAGKGQVRRDGWNWYFVPQMNGEGQSALQDTQADASSAAMH